MRIIQNKTLLVFLVFHFLIWSLLPLLRTSLPMDSIEAVAWGWLCDFGTNKHPPLSGHLAYWFYTFGNQTPYSIYALSQVCALVGFIYIYRLASRFMDAEKATLAVILLEGVIYYGFSSPEYNVNVVSLALWPATAYYFYRAVVKSSWLDWTLTGLFAGLNLFNKYVSAVLLVCMMMFMLIDRKARNRFREVGPYLCVIVTLLTIAPHVFWLVEHNFFPKDYLLSRGTSAGFSATPLLKHLIYPLKFFAAQIMFSLGSLLVFAVAVRKTPRQRTFISNFERRFMFWLGVAPVLLMGLISLVGAIKLKSMWGYPALYMLGIWLITHTNHRITELARRRMIFGVYVLMFLMGIAYAAVTVFNKGDKMHLNPQAYADQMSRIWDEHTGGKPLKYVAGDVWLANNVALFSTQRPQPVIWGKASHNPWINRQDLAQSGALLVAANEQEYENMRRMLHRVTPPEPLEIRIRNPLGKIKTKHIYYGFYNMN